MDLKGKNVTVDNEILTIITLTVEPDIGKQIIKFDEATQTIKVADYDERYDGTYKVTLKVQSEQRLRTVTFDIVFH